MNIAHSSVLYHSCLCKVDGYESSLLSVSIDEAVEYVYVSTDGISHSGLLSGLLLAISTNIYSFQLWNDVFVMQQFVVLT